MAWFSEFERSIIKNRLERQLPLRANKRNHDRSFDHLVGDGEQVVWNCEVKRFGSLEVNHKLELGRQHDRKVRWLFALKNPAGVDAGLAKGVSVNGVGSIERLQRRQSKQLALTRPFGREVAEAGHSDSAQSGYRHVNRKFADRSTMVVTVHAATVARRHVSIT